MKKICKQQLYYQQNRLENRKDVTYMIKLIRIPLNIIIKWMNTLYKLSVNKEVQLKK